jgi:2-keto-3-deoxy-L-rhamnonate aldolase RhmA
MILTWQQIPSNIVSEILASTKVDGVVLDAEHGLFDIGTMHSCAQVILLREKRCFVRMQKGNKQMMQAALDSGCDIITANTDPDDIIEIATFCLHRHRGVGLVRANTWGKDKLIYEDPILVAQIENHTSLNKLIETSDNHLNRIDFFMVGQYDLSKSLGDPGNFYSEKYIRWVRAIEERLPLKRLGVHLVRNYDRVGKYRSYGLVALGMDTTILLDGTEAVMAYDT